MVAMSLRLLGIFSSYIFIILITKNFGSEGWGRYSLTMSFVIFGILLGKAGFDLALLKYTSANEAKNERSVTRQIYFKGILFCLSISLALTIMLAVFSKEVAVLLFKKEYLSDYLFYGSFLIVLQVVFLIHSEGLRGLKKNYSYLFVQFIGIYFFGSLFLFLCLQFNLNNDLLSIQILVASSLLVFLISTYLWLKEIWFVKKERLPSFPLGKILKVSFPMFLSNTMFVILSWIDTLLLGVFQVDESEIGIYNVSLKVAAVMNLPLLAISGIIASNISEHYTKGDMANLGKTIQDSTRIIFSASVFIYILYLLFPSFFLGFFGDEFIKGSPVLIIISTGFLVSSFSGCTDIILQMTNHEKLFKNIIIGGAIVNLTLNLILIPTLGIIGAAIANMASACFWNLLSVYYIKKRLKLSSLFSVN